MHSRVYAGLEADEHQLSARERGFVSRAGFGPRRRDEWIRGRMGARRLLHEVLGPAAERIDVLADERGAPVLHGIRGWSLSLTHDGDLVGVALGRVRCAIDLCRREHAQRLARLVPRVSRGDVEPLSAWVAIEAWIKLRGGAMWSLLDRPVALRPAPGGVRVQGDGAPLAVRVREHGTYVEGLACTS